MKEILLAGVGTVLEYNSELTPGMLAENLHDQFAHYSVEKPTPFLSADFHDLEEAVYERRQIIES
jgi:hypothetical protein